MPARSGETARPASGKSVSDVHRPAAWRLINPSDKVSDLIRKAAMRRLERWIGAALVAGVLIAAGAAAEEPRHLDGEDPVSMAERRRAVFPALVKPVEICPVGAFGEVGAVAGRDFLWAHYDFMPAPGDQLHTLRWPRVVIFERRPAGPSCAEGGRAPIDLQWRGDRIAVGSMRIGKAGECGEALPR
jgi:hypothetical protein